MTKTIYRGHVEVEIDEERGVVWVNADTKLDGSWCLIRICQINPKTLKILPKYSERPQDVKGLGRKRNIEDRIPQLDVTSIDKTVEQIRLKQQQQ